MFFQDVKDNVFVDHDREEIRDIQKSVEIMLNRLTKLLEKSCPIYSIIRIVPCGSMAEHTRNWKFLNNYEYGVLEFDYLAVLEDSSLGQSKTTNTCAGFMQIEILNQSGPILKFCRRPFTTLEQKSLSFAFHFDLLKSINSLCSCMGFIEQFSISRVNECCKACIHGEVYKQDTFTETCERCHVKTATGVLRLATGTTSGSPYTQNCSLVFEWNRHHCDTVLHPRTGNDEKVHKVLILVDYLPTVELNSQSSKRTISDSNTQTDGISNHFLVPKCCYRNHHFCWKISHCESEVQILRSTEVAHRHAYRVLKFLFEHVFKGFPISATGIPATYKLKTAVMHHCQACTNNRNWIKCTLEILRYLSNFYSTNGLPHFFSNLNLLTPVRLDAFPKQHLIWTNNRNKIIGDCLLFIYKFFTEIGKSHHNMYNEYSYSNLTEALNFIGNVFRLAWIQTEVDNIYKVHKKELFQVLRDIFVIGGKKSHILMPEKYIFKIETEKEHWTKFLHFVEYAEVRKLFAFHHMDFPDPPGRVISQEESYFEKYKIKCGYHTWSKREQSEWIETVKRSEDIDCGFQHNSFLDLYYVKGKKTHIKE